MPVFLLLIFGWDDEVHAVKNVRAPDLPSAFRLAEIVMTTHPRSAGYQLWLHGRRVYATFPIEAAPVSRPRLKFTEEPAPLSRSH